MKEKNLIIGAAFCGILFCFILIFFRAAPSFKIWQNYTVFYTDRTVSEDTVLDIFSEAGINGVLSIFHMQFPPVPSFTPVQYLNGFSTFSYEDLQNLFFSDKNGTYRLYYVPQEAARTAAAALKSADFVWGTDARGKRPYSVPAAVFVLFICFMFFSKNKAFFAAAFFPFVLYSFSVPFYHSASFVCLLGFSLFIIQKSWRRRGFLKKALMQPLFLSGLVLLSVSSFFSGLRPFFLFIAAVFASVCAVYVLFKLEGIIRSSASFNPVPIMCARRVDTRDIFRIRFALVPALCICVFTAALFINGVTANISFFGKKTGFLSGASTLYLPAPIKKTIKNDFSLFSYKALCENDMQNRLPDLSDFIQAFWFCETYPFRKLDKNKETTPRIGDKVVYSSYKKDGQRLVEFPVTVAVFDEAYIQRITDLAYRSAFSGSGGAEALLSRQGGFMRTGYIRAHGGESGTVPLVFTLSAFIYILVLLIRLVKYRLL